MFLDNGAVLDDNHARVGAYDGLERDGVGIAEDVLGGLLVPSEELREFHNLIFPRAGEDIGIGITGYQALDFD